MRSNVVKFKTLDGATTYDSVTDWGMTLTHCDEQKPAPKFERIDVPGANGSVDISAALSGDIPFNDREIELTFNRLCADHDAAYSLAGDVAAAIHGKQMQLQTPDSYADGNTWYTGDVEITRCTFDDRNCEIDVRAVCSPYRYAASYTSQALAGAAATELQQSMILELSNGEFDTPGVQFTFDTTAANTWIDPQIVGVECASTDNLFDMDLTAVRGVTCKTGESWQRSNNISQDGQTLSFGAVNANWCERATATATSATANIDNVRLPFTTDSHLYVFVESSPITAKQSITVDGATRAAGVQVKTVGIIGGSIGSNGLTTSGVSSTVGTLAAPAVGSSFNAVIDCGVVDTGLGQIAVDVSGVTATSFNAQIMLVKNGVSVSSYIVPSVHIARAVLPVALDKTSTGTDVYTSYPPAAWVTQNSTGGGNVSAQPIADYSRDSKYVEFCALTASGDVAEYPLWYAHASIWPTQTATVDAGDMPVYPGVRALLGALGFVISYNGAEYLVGPTGAEQLPTLLNRGSNTVDYVAFTAAPQLPAGTLRWLKGVL